jgi:hypothetical protein
LLLLPNFCSIREKKKGEKKTKNIKETINKI